MLGNAVHYVVSIDSITDILFVTTCHYHILTMLLKITLNPNIKPNECCVSVIVEHNVGDIASFAGNVFFKVKAVAYIQKTVIKYHFLQVAEVKKTLTALCADT